MTKTDAWPISKVAGMKMTDDGQHMLLRLEQPEGGTDITLAIPRNQMLSLSDLGAAGFTQSDKIRGTPKERREAFPTSYWDLWFQEGREALVLTLTFGTGGRLSFRLDRGMGEAMRDTLATMLGQPSLQTPETPKH